MAPDPAALEAVRIETDGAAVRALRGRVQRDADLLGAELAAVLLALVESEQWAGASVALRAVAETQSIHSDRRHALLNLHAGMQAMCAVSRYWRAVERATREGRGAAAQQGIDVIRREVMALVARVES